MMWLRERLHREEDGRIMLLLLGVSTVVLALVLVVASVTAIHIERKRLLAAAEAAALSAAAALDEEGFYAVGGSRIVVSDESVAAAVHDYLTDHAATLGLREVSVGEPTGAAGDGVEVTLSALAEVPFVPWLTDAIPEVLRVEVTAHAQAQDSLP